MNAHAAQPTGSAYFLTKETATPERHTLSVLVDNEPGILARIVGLFAARGFNIDSLTVSETEHEKGLSRITVVTVATPKVLLQIKLQLERLVPVHKVHDLTAEGKALERELALIKVGGGRAPRRDAAARRSLSRADRRCDGRQLCVRGDGQAEQDRLFIALMVPLGLIEVVRTGLAAISRGPEGM